MRQQDETERPLCYLGSVASEPRRRRALPRYGPKRADFGPCSAKLIFLLDGEDSSPVLRLGLTRAPAGNMRRLLIVVVIIGLGYLFLRQKENEKSGTARTPVPPQTAAPLTPAPRGQASDYNYMKRALDRAHSVTDESRARTQDAQNP